jgi:hypothetical protein
LACVADSASHTTAFETCTNVPAAGLYYTAKESALGSFIKGLTGLMT